MSNDRIDVTSEAVNAVANHLQLQSEFRERGWAGYLFKDGDADVRLAFFDADKYELVEKKVEE